MRTTVNLDDRLAKTLRKRAAESGRTFQAELNEAVERGIGARPRPRRFRQKTYSMGGPEAGVDLDRALALADAVEDAELARKLLLRK